MEITSPALSVSQTEAPAETPRPQPRKDKSQATVEQTGCSRPKPRLEDVICRKFDGREVYPGLGCGFRDFILAFEHAIATEQLINGSEWTSELKAAVLPVFLEGKVARYYHTRIMCNRQDHIGYDGLKHELGREYGCKLSKEALMQKLNSPKRKGDSWDEYLDYLRYIVFLMGGDRSKLLLQTVCRNACPEVAPELLCQVNRESADYDRELSNVLRLLYSIKGDGRRVGAGKPAVNRRISRRTRITR